MLIRIARVVTAVLTAVALATTCGYQATTSTATLASADHRASTASPLTRPNIVFFLTDDQTFQSLQHMPYLNSQSWTRFTNAWVENALCCPSRATILQGRYDTRTGVGNNKQGWRFNPTETVAVWLQRRGYNTALIGKYLNGVTTSTQTPPGWNDWEAVLPDHYMYRQYGYRLNDNGTVIQYGTDPASYEADVLTRRARRYIAAEATAHQPFFLYFAVTATHGPWVASPRRTGMFDTTPVTMPTAFDEADVSDKPAWVRALPTMDPTAVANQRRREWAAGVSVDDALATVDAQLSASGVADNTVVVFTDDNGYSFGSNRYHGKMCEYADCSSVPLLVRYPGVKPHNVSILASNVDIAETLADIGGATPALTEDGRSLLPMILGQPIPSHWRQAVLQHWTGGDNVGSTGHGIAIPAFCAVRSTFDGAKYAYVELSTGEEELYDESADPQDLSNVAGEPAYAAAQTAMAVRLAELEHQATSSTGKPFYHTGKEPPNLQIAPDD